jgi:mRNA interferase MazF
MVRKSYIPDRGDIVWVDLNPTKGREQSKTRPAIIISPKSYNQKTHLALMCPITSSEKGYPFEVKVENKKVTGVILSDHVRSLDWKVRRVEYIAKADSSVLHTVQARLRLLLSDE